MGQVERTIGGVAAALMVVLATFGPVAAQEADLESAFETLDGNGDGVLTREEFDQNKVKVFFSTLQEMARDKSLDFEDTRLTRAAFDAADTDGDGRLSGAEWVLADFGQFSTYDPDGDGAITFDEFAAKVSEYLR